MTSSDPKKGILSRLFSAFPLFAAKPEKEEARHHDLPLTQPLIPLRQAVLALVTTGGVYLDSQPPFDVTDPDGDPGFREIPIETSRELIRLTHDYYDQSDAEADLNLVLPIERLQEFRRAGALGQLHGTAYSVMGHVLGSRLEELKEQTAAEVAGKLAAAGVEYALLIPACGCCNRTVGVIARAVEAAGVATVSLSSSLEITAVAPPPRALFLRFPFGNALGEPGNRNQQCTVLYLAFKLLFEADAPGTIAHAGLRWRRERYPAPDWDEIKKLEPLQGSGGTVNS